MTTTPISYSGRHSKLYDVFYAEKPYAGEAAFIHHWIQTYRPNANRLLELACGTGSHSLQLEKYGYKIIATDYSSDMLARAKEKAQKTNSNVDFRLQDMRTLNVPDHPFDAVVCLFDSIGYVVTNENVLRVFCNVFEHLLPGGIFLFEFWHAGAMIRGYDSLRIRRWQVPEGTILRISETAIDYKNQVCNVAYTITEMDDDGTYRTLQETQINRFFLIQEMKFFLDQAGFEPLKWFSGYQENEHITGETWHVVAVAQKPENR